MTELSLGMSIADRQTFSAIDASLLAENDDSNAVALAATVAASVDPPSGEVLTSARTASVAAPIPTDSLVGQVLADTYEIRRLLGSGGIGDVWLATHRLLGTHWAIKILHAHISRQERFAELVKHEARVTAQLRAAGVTGIAEVPHVGQLDDGRWYMVVQFLRGHELSEEVATHALAWAEQHGKLEGKKVEDFKGDDRVALKQKLVLPREAYQLPIERAVELALQVARIMASAHRRGVIHRDLKPQNIFIVRQNGHDEYVVVLDFGHAWVPDSGDYKGFEAPCLGSPCYMPPEQVTGTPQANEQSDVYSVAAMLYELLAGEWTHEATSAPQVMKARCEQEARLVSHWRRDVPRGIEKLLADSLAIDRKRRPATMIEFRERLERAVLTKPRKQSRVGWFARWALLLALLAGAIGLVRVEGVDTQWWRGVGSNAYELAEDLVDWAGGVVDEVSDSIDNAGIPDELRDPSEVRKPDPAIPKAKSKRKRRKP